MKLKLSPFRVLVILGGTWGVNSRQYIRSGMFRQISNPFGKPPERVSLCREKEKVFALHRRKKRERESLSSTPRRREHFFFSPALTAFLSGRSYLQPVAVPPPPEAPYPPTTHPSCVACLQILIVYPFMKGISRHYMYPFMKGISGDYCSH